MRRARRRPHNHTNSKTFTFTSARLAGRLPNIIGMQICMQQEQKERQMSKAVLRSVLSIAFSAMLVSVAEAHPGHDGASGFVHGIGHPLSGVDHVFAMVAVGLLACHLGGRALWLVPSCFVSMMALGGALGITGTQLPLVELGIATSVVVLGGLVALQYRMPTIIAMGLAGFFAMFHGYAHGAEMPNDASGLFYAAGFVTATAMLHIVGIGMGFGLTHLSSQYSRHVAQVGGAAIAATGLGLAAGLF
jgi:urease accessory protein